MAWALDLHWVRAAGEDDEEEGEDGVVKNVLQVPYEIKTIQEALDKSRDGDTIAIAPGYYNESLQIRTDVTIRSEVPPFLPKGAEPDVHVVAVTGKGSALRISPARRKSSDGHHHHRTINVKLLNLHIHHDEPASLDEHCVEVEESEVHVDTCTLTGGTHCIFGSRGARVHINDSTMAGARRAGLSFYSGARLRMRDCHVVASGEDGVSVCGWTSTKAPAGTGIDIETCKIVGSTFHGVLVSGGAEATLTGVDVTQSQRAGVFVLHGDSTCALDLCRITGTGTQGNNGWHGAVLHAEQHALPKSLKIRRCDLRRNAAEPCHVSDKRLAQRVRIDKHTKRDPNDTSRADQDPGLEIGNWLELCGLRELESLFLKSEVSVLKHAEGLTYLDLQGMGIRDAFVIRLILTRLAPCPDTSTARLDSRGITALSTAAQSAQQDVSRLPVPPGEYSSAVASRSALRTNANMLGRNSKF